ncbi:CDGSH iron-sulfur domain-containing protein [Streptomyces sp. AS02]|uniref:CDGSH iron-sulfur domain-containing protein n=1 Tax=Streptomyces sp. AS02 TaxID=2938946 RepID=UPI00202129F2|nr:CDGSH iron-sulfur domain-containing protein [Streptomyces sp. AS02]MCL8010154.1 CDGSH iron-sulfur domain-containing protein [Streptomyces sp. AS02]
MPNTPERPHTPQGPRRVRVRAQRDGPLLIEGPVEVVDENGEVTVSQRFAVAICTCRRSRIFPWCDTSHRRHERRGGEDGAA